MSEQRLIDANALKEVAKTKFGNDITSITVLKLFEELIDNAPTVNIKDQIAGAYNEGYMCGNKEAEKARPQGEWYYSCDKGWECNQCHEIVKDMPTCMRKALYNFCPNCGADMRGDENGKS